MSSRLAHVINIRLGGSTGFMVFVAVIHLWVLLLITVVPVWFWLRIVAAALWALSVYLIYLRIVGWRNIIGLRISDDGIVLLGRLQDVPVKTLLSSVETRLFVVLTLVVGASGSGLAERKHILPVFVDSTTEPEMRSLRRYLRAG